MPAGFEIDNPGLVNSASLSNFDWIGEVEAAHTEFRSDRFVAAFDRATGDNGEITLAYVVRAVTPGTYDHPAARQCRGHVSSAVLRAYGNRSHGGRRSTIMWSTRKLCIGISANLVLATVLAFGLDLADRTFPPPLEKAREVSTEVLDADGQLLRAFATSEGRWRLGTTAKDVDPQFERMLIAYEDQRFWQHRGVDPIALAPAAVQLVSNGRIVSGARRCPCRLPG